MPGETKNTPDITIEGSHTASFFLFEKKVRDFFDVTAILVVAEMMCVFLFACFFNIFFRSQGTQKKQGGIARNISENAAETTGYTTQREDLCRSHKRGISETNTHGGDSRTVYSPFLKGRQVDTHTTPARRGSQQQCGLVETVRHSSTPVGANTANASFVNSFLPSF